MNKAMFLDAVGMLDTDLVEAYALRDQRLRARKSGSSRRYLAMLLAAALSLMLAFALLVTSLPLIYLTNREAIDTAVGEAVDRVIFPLDQEDADIKQEDLLLNWTEWDVTQQLFAALGAGTDHSYIDMMQNVSDGLFGDLMRMLAKLLERMFAYYEDHGTHTEQESGSGIGDHTKNELVLRVEPNGEYCTLVGVESYQNPHIRLPGKYEGMTINAIGDGAFRDLTDIESIVLSQRVETVGAYAFAGCTSLESVEMPVVDEIGEAAFAGCESLTEVIAPELIMLGERAFSDCTKLKTLSLPEVRRLPAYVFSGCSSLQETTFGELYEVGDYAFENCTSIQTYRLEKTVTKVGVGCFAGCTSLQDADILGVTYMSDYMFDGCTSLTIVQYYYSLEEIGSYALRNCSRFISFAGTWAVKQIGDRAFEGCGMTMIDLYLFSSDTLPGYLITKCPNLRTVVIPSNVKKIESYAIYDCKGTVGITYQGTRAQWERIELEPDALPRGTIVRCDDGSVTVE